MTHFVRKMGKNLHVPDKTSTDRIQGRINITGPWCGPNHIIVKLAPTTPNYCTKIMALILN